MNFRETSGKIGRVGMSVSYKNEDYMIVLPSELYTGDPGSICPRTQIEPGSPGLSFHVTQSRNLIQSLTLTS